jgi:hypothetical protein
MKKTITVICLSAFLFAAQSQSASADNVQAMSGNQGQRKDTKGSHCSFSRAEKIWMLLWIVPFAGAVYTPFACKRERDPAQEILPRLAVMQGRGKAIPGC